MRALGLWLLLALPTSAAEFRPPVPPALPAPAAGLAPRAPALLPVPAFPALAVALPAPRAAAGPAVAGEKAPSAYAALASAGGALAAPEGAAAPEAPLEALWTGRRGRSAAAAAALLGTLVEAARPSPTAARVLERVAAAARRGGQVRVEVKPLDGVLGEYDYSIGILRLDSLHAAEDPRQAAATLIHELVHVLQHAEDRMPAEALEMEMEAHAVSVRVLDELGVPEAQRDWFSRGVKKSLRRGPDVFERWLAGRLPGKWRHGEDSASDMIDELESEADGLFERAEAAKRGGERWLALAQRAQSDADWLKTRRGRAAYKRFAERVRRLLEAESARLRR
jgi:hypothetical protein